MITNKTYHFFAFDLGATSGRSILGTLNEKKLSLQEITRFPNRIKQQDGKCFWDIDMLFEELKKGLSLTAQMGIKLDSIGIDTWGVDMTFWDEDGKLLSPPRAYRDAYTNGVPELFFKLICKEKVYQQTGIQIMNFNSLFQLYATQLESSSFLDKVHTILFMPDAFSYMLTGKKVCEYTIASTSQMLDPKTKNFVPEFFKAMKLPSSLMNPVIMPGEPVGIVLPEIADECGIGTVPVITVAGHDTGSAVAAVPTNDKHFAYLSSGTWSLMGIELQEAIITEETFKMNFTNEGGVDGTIRFLKNITGMWLLEQCLREWEAAGYNYSYPQIIEMAESQKKFISFIDPDHPSFANPGSMITAITDFCGQSEQPVPDSHAAFIRCIFDSLALKYKSVFQSLCTLAPFPIHRLYIIGGGAKNELLNQATANAIGVPVEAGLAEATAIGNILVQAKGIGLFSSLEELRECAKISFTPQTFLPQETDLWNQAYKKFNLYIK